MSSFLSPGVCSPAPVKIPTQKIILYAILTMAATIIPMAGVDYLFDHYIDAPTKESMEAEGSNMARGTGFVARARRASAAAVRRASAAAVDAVNAVNATVQRVVRLKSSYVVPQKVKVVRRQAYHVVSTASGFNTKLHHIATQVQQKFKIIDDPEILLNEMMAHRRTIRGPSKRKAFDATWSTITGTCNCFDDDGNKDGVEVRREARTDDNDDDGNEGVAPGDVKVTIHDRLNKVRSDYCKAKEKFSKLNKGKMNYYLH
jgi:hypothetical protein